MEPSSTAGPMDSTVLMARYDRELDRKETLNGAVSLPVTILAVLGGVIATIARDFAYGWEGLQVAFVLALAVYVACTGHCLYWLARNYGGSTYHLLPTLEALDEVLGRLQAEVFEQYFRVAIIEAADANASVNEARMAYIDRANQTLVAVLVSTAFCGGLYVVSKIV